MTAEYNTLRDRIEKYGSMCSVDEFGSHGEDTINLYSRVTAEEAQELSALEANLRDHAVSAVA